MKILLCAAFTFLGVFAIVQVTLVSTVEERARYARLACTRAINAYEEERRGMDAYERAHSVVANAIERRCSGLSEVDFAEAKRASRWSGGS